MEKLIIPVNKMYEQRRDFTIVALTGITGSGCSKFAEMMSSDFNTIKNDIREPDSITIENKKHDIVFKREYKKCYDFFQKKHEKFEIIKYKNVLIFYLLHNLAQTKKNDNDFVNSFCEVLNEKYAHSHTTTEDDYPAGTFNQDKIKGELKELYSSFSNIEEFNYNTIELDSSINEELKKIDRRKKIAELFNNESFNSFCEHLFDEMKKNDYYSKNFFVHRLASAIRATGDPTKKYDDYKNSVNSDNLFKVVELINDIIKGYHCGNENARRFVIDSIRNSMEILYLRERYNAFYMIAMHNDNKENAEIYKKVNKYESEEEKRKKICKYIANLSEKELKTDDFEKGKLFAQDIKRCVSESELHISFNSIEDLKTNSNDQNSFFTYTEQWMKYYSLIRRPGLITPTRDERCMSIAYVAKFNSGCLSRQVGCTIVDKENAVQSIGWNDPPTPQLPCSLRYLDELRTEKKLYEIYNDRHKKNETFYIYSQFELVDNQKYEWNNDIDNKNNPYDNNEYGFCNCTKKEVPDELINKIKEDGLSYPYCFRSRYNTYKNNKDNVNTRSLHAEENAMLRIAHRGGVGLDGGTMYVTASPCILCSKKAYQIGIKDIVYLDPYTDIAPDLILHCGLDQPKLRPFRGAIGATFYKLYQPFLPYKDELNIIEKKNS